MKARRAEKKNDDRGCFCPYCEEPLQGALSEYCVTCQVKTFVCPVCRTPISREERKCPTCGAEIG